MGWVIINNLADSLDAASLVAAKQQQCVCLRYIDTVIHLSLEPTTYLVVFYQRLSINSCFVWFTIDKNEYF